MILTLPDLQTEEFGLPLRAALGGILGDLTRMFATLESTIDDLVDAYPGSMGLLPRIQLAPNFGKPPTSRVESKSSSLLTR